ncbi:uncharacterized protein A4U43_C06F7880 [Asparagus officinalis]|uniref:Uncharacterized protein n=1 Tax=Asparagus officinalis TaxID=4686 RepID=A0A5P1EKJ8_ASPOF|nr:uncharacterized protein LOC109845169 [Asparagus officinalis]ONK66426.1 uncharacterized protein A4U43_C06F7880 [Asparagus officinalis]
MENSKEMIAASSPSEANSIAEADSHLSALLYDVSQEVQVALENMLKMTSEINQSAGEISREIEKCRQSESAKNKILEEEKERFQKAAIAVLQMLRHN